MVSRAKWTSLGTSTALSSSHFTTLLISVPLSFIPSSTRSLGRMERTSRPNSCTSAFEYPPNKQRARHGPDEASPLNCGLDGPMQCGYVSAALRREQHIRGRAMPPVTRQTIADSILISLLALAFSSGSIALLYLRGTASHRQDGASPLICVLDRP